MQLIINRRVRVSFFSNLLVLFFSISYLLRNFFENTFLFSMLMCFFAVLSFIIILIFDLNKKNICIIFFLLLYTICGILSNLYNDNIGLNGIILPISYGAISMILLNYKMQIKIFERLFYMVCLLFLLQIILGKSPDGVLAGVSRNNISVIILWFLSLYYISCYDNKIQTKILPVIIVLVISLWAIGRAGILSSLVLLILDVNSRYVSKKGKIITKFKVIIIILIIIILVFIGFNDIITRVMENFGYRGLESTRTLIWSKYFNQVLNDGKNLLLGVPKISEEIFIKYNGNLHNSFFNLHSGYGLIFFLITLFLILKSLSYYIKSKNDIYINIIIVLFFRTCFDYVAFTGIYDVLFIYFIFESKYPFKKGNM